MPEESLRSAMDAISRRLQEEVETQLSLLDSRHQDEVEVARRAADADAEQRWAAKVEAVRAEWAARLESEVAIARSEADRRMVAESMRLRVEAEQEAAESAARVRQEIEDAVAAERERAADLLGAERERAAGLLAAERGELSGERERLQHEMSGERERLQHEIGNIRRELESIEAELDGAATARREAELALTEERQARDERWREEETRRHEQAAAAAMEAHLVERQAQLVIVERLLTAIRSLDSAPTLSEVLSALISSAAAEAPRVALFVVNGEEVRPWKAAGFEGAVGTFQVGAADRGLFGEALHRREPVVTADAAGPPAPAFAELPADRAAIAIPLLVGAHPVGLLYADDGSEAPRETPASWPEAIQILCRHASVSLAHLTAARAAEVMRRSLSPASAGPASSAKAAGASEDAASARRYARLLVSEIKLYHEVAVRIGRQNRDLLERLKPEIDRARRLYEQRMSSSVDSQGVLFRQELVQTLADGDPALLGGSA